MGESQDVRCCCVFAVEFQSEDNELDLDFIDDDEVMEMDFGEVIGVNVPKYDGPYLVTPSTEVQRLHTKDLLSTGDIVVDRIPSNYGLITWDGSVLTVS